MADHLAALFRSGKLRGERNDLLSDGGGGADQDRGQQQQRRRRAGGHAGEGGDQRQRLRQNQPLAVHGIAERNQQDQAEGEPQLRHGGYQADQRGCAPLALQQAQQGLVVIDVGDGKAAGDGHDQYQPEGECLAHFVLVIAWCVKGGMRPACRLGRIAVGCPPMAGHLA